MSAANVPLPPVSDGDLVRSSSENPGWKIERADSGSLTMSPAYTPGGAKSAEALFQLCMFVRAAGGKACGSSTGFKTPGGGVVSPDASWCSAERVARFQGEQSF